MRISVIIFSILIGLSYSCKTEGVSTSDQAKETTESTAQFKDGPYLEYHETGEIKIVGEYKNGQREGLWSSWYTNGELQSELNYEKGLEDGEYKVFHTNGNLKIRGFYKAGKEVKEWIFFNEEGQEITRKNYDA